MSTPEEVQSLVQQGESFFQSRDFKAASETFRRAGALASILNPPATPELTNKISMWTRKCETHLKDEAEAENKRVAAEKAAAAASTNTATPQPPQTSIRHEWFQSLTNITLSFYVKNYTPEDVTVTAPATNQLVIKLKDETLSFGPLYGHIVQDGIVTNVKSMKVEVLATKASQGNWGGLLLGSTGNITSAAPVTAPTTTTTTTAKPKNKDWSKEKIEIPEEEGKPSGDQALQALFKDIYSKASDETRMAMMKSYQESGGTVLSTNWADVGARKVEVQAPKGMEAKKWNE